MKKNTLHYKKSAATPALPKIKTEWDLTLYYKNEHDPQIEKDIVASINAYTSFAKKWRNKKFTSDANLLYKALTDYEALGSNTSLIQGLG